jgi:hypothetical protein
MSSKKQTPVDLFRMSRQMLLGKVAIRSLGRKG